MKLLMLLAVAVLVFFCHESWFALDRQSSATFVQISDLHIFDEGKPRFLSDGVHHDQWRNDEKAFDWALKTIRNMDNLRFLVFTGDLGLEMTGPYWEAAAAQYLADKLSDLPVEYILFVPGNNDLLNEEPKDVERYRSLVKELKKHLHQIVMDLTQDSLHLEGMWIYGLDSASFKNAIQCRISFKNVGGLNHGAWEGVSFSPRSGTTGVEGLWCKPKDIEDRIRAQAQEMNRLSRAISVGGTSDVHVVFTHIPPLDDPTSPDGTPLSSTFRSQQPGDWDAKTFPVSWNLDIATRDLWLNRISPKVTCMFAGHFHSDDWAYYGVRGRKQGLCNKEIAVSPPIAIKYQDDKGTAARGILKGTVKNGAVSFQIVEYP